MNTSDKKRAAFEKWQAEPHRLGTYHSNLEAWQAAKAEQAQEVTALMDALNNARKACLCTRDVKGFDYHQKHPNLGTPPSGSERWATPREIIDDALRVTFPQPLQTSPAKEA